LLCWLLSRLLELRRNWLLELRRSRLLEGLLRLLRRGGGLRLCSCGCELGHDGC
jgi:hypothetical protein